MAKKDPNRPKKKMSPASLANLEPTKFNNLTPERRREIARMGAEATNKKINRRKTFREIIETLGPMGATDNEKEMFRQMFPDVDPDEITKDMMLIASMYRQAIAKGNVRASSMIRDTAGEKPDTNITGSITTEKVFITPDEQKEVNEHINKVIYESLVDKTEK